MKKLILLICLMFMVSCGRTADINPPAGGGGGTPAPPPVVGQPASTISWNSFVTNIDGTEAAVAGYKIVCSDSTGRTVEKTVGIVSACALTSIPFPGDGTWCCGVQAYNDISETDPSILACFRIVDGKYYK